METESHIANILGDNLKAAPYREGRGVRKSSKKQPINRELRTTFK